MGQYALILRETQRTPVLTPGHLPPAQYIFSGVKCISVEISWYPFIKLHPCFKTFPWDNSQARLVLSTSTTKQRWTCPNCRRTANWTDVKPFFYKFSAGTYHLLAAAELITGPRKEQEHPNAGRKAGVSESCLHCQLAPLSEPGLTAVIFYCSHITRSYFPLVKLSLCRTIESNWSIFHGTATTTKTFLIAPCFPHHNTHTYT